MLLFALLACPDPCPEGFESAGGRRCEPSAEESPDLREAGEGVEVTMSACAPGATDGRMDIVNGCADEVCVGMTQDAIVAVLGQPEEQTGEQWDWADGISVEWSGDVAVQVEVQAPWDGGSDAGLGPGASMQCFFDGLGDSDMLSVLFQDDGRYAIWSASWFDAGVMVFESDALLGEADDLVDSILLEGAGN